MLLKRLICLQICCSFLLVVELSGQQPRLIIPIGHPETILAADISPDGKRYITCSYDGKAKIWNKDGYELYSVGGFDRFAQYVEFNHDGACFLVRFEKTIAVYKTSNGEIVSHYTQDNATGIASACFMANSDQVFFTTYFTYGLVDTHTGDLIYEDEFGDEEIIASALSHDGTVVALARGKSISVQLALTGEKIQAFSSTGTEFTTVSITGDGKRLAAGAKNGEVMVWDLEKGELLFDLKGHKEKIISVCFNKIGNQLVSSDNDDMMILWNAGTGDSLHVMNKAQCTLGAFFNPANDKILCYSSWQVQSWDVKTGLMAYNFGEEHEGSRNSVDFTNIHCTRFSPDGKHIITSSADCTAKVWDAENGRLLTDLAGKTIQESARVYNDQNKILISGQIDGYIRFWDTRTGRLLSSSNEHNSWITEMAQSRDEKKLAVVSKNGMVSTWDMKTGQLIKKWRAHDGWIVSLEFNQDGSKLVTGSWDNTAAVWDFRSGKQLLLMDRYKEAVDCARFSPDGNYVFSVSRDGSAEVLRLSDSKLIRTFKTEGMWGEGLISADNKLLIVAGGSQLVAWDINTGKQVYSFESGQSIYELSFSKNGKKLQALVSNNPQFINDRPGKLVELDAQTGKVLVEEEIPGENGEANSVNLSIDGSDYLVATNKGTIFYFKREGTELKRYSIETNVTGWTSAFFTGKDEFMVATDFGFRIYKLAGGAGAIAITEKYTAINLDSLNFMTYIPSGYYQCSPNAAKMLHYVSQDLNVITFEQLDVKYNRPDKVLEAIGADTALIRYYRKAYDKRIKKLGIDTSSFRAGFSVPLSDFVNRSSFTYEQPGQKITLHIRSSDSVYLLDRFNIWINEVPLYGQRGVSIRNSNTHYLDTTITINLSPGSNRIENSVFNMNGSESFRMPVNTRYNPITEQGETLRFIGIGIDQFSDSKYNLQYSTKDIRDLSEKLKEKYGKNISIDTLFNSDVTISAIKALKQKLLQTNENDKVIIAYSGHGMLSKDYDYYLSTYSVNFDKPEENGLPYDELESLLDSIPARKKLMLIDACHSGEVDKEDLILINKATDSLKLKKGFKPVAYKKEAHLGLKNSFELMQSLFVNVGKSTGATIISAAAGTQFALERNDLKNGVFTYAILEAMKANSTMKLSELKSIVGKRVEELTKGLQKPTSRNETIAVDWNVW
ncbi:MAG: caspase family protein [Chitinophagaceae bacterium]